MIARLIARVLARPAVTSWLIRRAMRTPYTHLSKSDGVYMMRYWLFNQYPERSDGSAGRRWGNWIPSIRLHHILREDRDPHLHDHPWNARTFILRGWYDEYRPTRLRPLTTFAAGDTSVLRFGEYHRIAEVCNGGVWTLFITYRHRGTWGFLVNGHKVPWRQYFKWSEK